MYQPNISKSPLLSSGVIERDYASGLPEQAPETVAPSPAPAPEAPAPASDPVSAPEQPKKKIKIKGKPQTTPDPLEQAPEATAPASDPNNIESEPVDEFSFEETATQHLDDDVLDATKVDVEIPDDVAKETAKQFTMLLDMGVAMLCERKLVVDMNSIRTSITKGEMHPVFEEKFEQVNKANQAAAHLSKDNQKVVQQALTAIIKDQKIEALNPTNAALANLAMVGISHYATVSATIASNERMIASALEQTTANGVASQSPQPVPVQAQKPKDNNEKTF